jgi:transcriptional regulator with PAS, ATPase and Fis domain
MIISKIETFERIFEEQKRKKREKQELGKQEFNKIVGEHRKNAKNNQKEQSPARFTGAFLGNTGTCREMAGRFA